MRPPTGNNVTSETGDAYPRLPATATLYDQATQVRIAEGAAAMQSRPDIAARRYQRTHARRWDALARYLEKRPTWGGAYHRRLAEVYRFLVPAGQRVLEIGCAMGDLLAELKPAVGVGVDFSREILRRAEVRHPELRFVLADAHEFELEETFDVVILSDLLNDVWDVQTVLERVARACTPRTRVIINSYSRLWEVPLSWTAKLGLAKPTLQQNWLTVEDIANLLRVTGFEVLRNWQEVLLPLPIPGVARLCNRYLAKVWPLRYFALTNMIIATPQPVRPKLAKEPTVSVVVACRNEEGNVPQIFARVPELGAGTELIFVEGNSTDDTYGAIERAMAAEPERNCKLYRQPGKGKGDAVREGFAHATGDILMILDADLTVAPEDLPRFVDALRSGKGEFINGVRLVYPMEDRAMRFFNLLGNKFFGAAFTWVLGQPVKDTLCGTKVLWRRDYERIAANRSYFGDFDPFGDFDLLFGAARLNFRIVDMPIRYRERVYGDTNIERWKHGAMLFRMLMLAAGRLKFV